MGGRGAEWAEEWDGQVRCMLNIGIFQGQEYDRERNWELRLEM